MNTDNFQWTDELVQEYCGRILKSIPRCQTPNNETINNFKLSKQPPIGSRDKDWEILSFKQDSGITDLWVKFSHGWCRADYYGQPITKAYGDNEILRNPLYKIHSVRRISDGEVFQIGDYVTAKGYAKTNITKFHIGVGDICVHGRFLSWSDGYQPLREIIKLPTHSPKEENKRIAVIDFIYGGKNALEMDGYTFLTNDLIPKDKFPAIKKSIEAVLNEDTVVEHGIKDEYNGERMYRKSEVDAMMENVWNEARANHPIIGMKHDTFQAYLHSLPENKPSTIDKAADYWFAPCLSLNDFKEILDKRYTIIQFRTQFFDEVEKKVKEKLKL